MSTINLKQSGRYGKMINSVKSKLIDESDCLYFMHTPQGVIEVLSWDYPAVDFVSVAGMRGKDYVLFIFSEDVACGIPLEIRRKSAAATKEILGFARLNAK